MDDVVDAYVRTRAAVLDFARNTNEGERSPKRKMDTETPEDDDAPAPKKLRSSTRLRTSQGPRPPVQIEDSGDEEHRLSGRLFCCLTPQWINSSNIPFGFYFSDDDGMTACPICSRRMKEWQVFSHLDKCSGPTPSSPSSSRALGNLEAGRQSNASPRKQQNNMERLPALNYSMIKEQALRKKLAELGISSTGPRALLERRHKEWCTMWNANCDAVKPKPRAQLLRDLETWERTQGGRAPPAFRNTTSIKDKEFDGSAWAAKYDESFKDLIANARRNRPQKPESLKKDGDAADDACSNEVLSL